MSGYIGVQPVPQATQRREYFTATSGQTTFNTNGYTPNYIDVYMNGVKLSPADFTASNGSDVVLASGATTGDLVQVVSFTPFNVANQTFIGDVNLSSGAYKIGGNTAINSSRAGSLTSLALTGNATFGDNDKAIFGAGSDLQIYHDGSSGHSIITESGGGALQLQGENLVLEKPDGTNYLLAVSGASGYVKLYQNGSEKLSTSSTGISVTGGVTTDAYSYLNGLRISGADTGNTVYQQSGDLSISSASGAISLKPSGANILHATNTGVGIGASPSTRLTVGAGVSSEEIRVDAGAGWADLTLNSNSTNGGHIYFNDGSNAGEIFYYHASDYMAFNTAGAEAMRIDASGRVGIGITPAAVADNTGADSLQLGGTFLIHYDEDGPGTTTLGNNIYYNGTANKALFTGATSQYYQAGGTHVWRNSGSTSAGSTTTMSESMRIDSSGHAIIPAGVTLGTSAGVYNAANTLDDYEEGTHQITVTMSSSGTVTLNTSFDRFSYTKVGRLVTITGNPRISSVSSPVGNLQLTLPFTAVGGQTDECRAGGIMRYYDNSAGAGSYSRPMAWSIQEGASTLIIENTHTNGNNLTPAASDEFYFSISYMTT